MLMFNYLSCVERSSSEPCSSRQRMRIWKSRWSIRIIGSRFFEDDNYDASDPHIKIQGPKEFPTMKNLEGKDLGQLHRERHRRSQCLNSCLWIRILKAQRSRSRQASLYRILASSRWQTTSSP